MAGSRMEKLSTIFKRYSGLIKSGGVMEENRPLWYDVYQAFPPKVEPLAIRDKPSDPITNIYYPEDILRARFDRAYGNNVTTFDFVTHQPTESVTKSMGNPIETFISKYLQLAKEKVEQSDSAQAGLKHVDLNDQALFNATEAELVKNCGIKLKRQK